MWDYCGMERTAHGLEKALAEIPALHAEFRKDLRVLGRRRRRSTSRWRGRAGSTTSSSSAAMCRDALEREECCGGHFRAEHQTEEGEARRDDERFAHVARLGVDRRSPVHPAEQGAARVRQRQLASPELQVTNVT